MSNGNGRVNPAWALCLALLVSACGGAGESDTAQAPAEEPTAGEPGQEAEPRVFFVEPADGATVTAPVHLVFGAENFTIEPAGDGAVHAGAGHMHIGLNTDCLPAGEVIPTANPWVHFGMAQMEFDLDLPAGEHRIVLQVGDGEHRTLADPGLCTSITVVAE